MIASKIQIVFGLLATLAAVQAQSSTTNTAAIPTSTAGINPCILGCVTSAATANGCVSFTNVTCVCGSQAFQGAALSCLQANCTAADVTAATALQSQLCGTTGATGSGTGTGSGTASPTGTGSGTATGTGTGTGAGTATTPAATNTSPAAGTTTAGGTTTGGSTAPPATTTNAAVGKAQAYGFVGAVVAGAIGLML